jgi:hypothetical protein
MHRILATETAVDNRPKQVDMHGEEVDTVRLCRCFGGKGMRSGLKTSTDGRRNATLPCPSRGEWSRKTPDAPEHAFSGG